jgi:hypothetical protein
MANDAHMHLVEFDMYCPSCKYVKVKQEDEPCNTCLNVAARNETRKPEKWEENT